ncbi:hypothetical protein AOA80_09270 [Methanomassiliicoccales archaeon RumEn M1]|nr:hypothetical protein AOA80_09270 [Methanomassiliicoccales archaeon RumEn M1]
MRGLYLLALLVLLLPTAQPGLSSISDGPEVQTVFSTCASGAVLMVEVSPCSPSEHIIVECQGGTVDLSGWSFADGEGTVTLINASLADGERLALAADPETFVKLHPDTRFLSMSSGEVHRAGRFTLADAGDCVKLYDPAGVLHDSLYYGKTADELEGWEGAPVPSLTKGHAAVRIGGDTDTAEDWSVRPPGRSSVAVGTFQATVEPFTAPEEARERVLKEISLASSSIKAAVYELTDVLIVSALSDRARQGVDVQVLVEGQPVAGIDERCSSALAALKNAGCQVKVLSSLDGYKRYDYLHCKYLIVDQRRSLVMSENWANGLLQNRGWGAVCDDRQMALHLSAVFDEDFAGTIDVREPTAAIPMGWQPWPTPELPYRRYVAEVTPLVSPDNAEGQYIDLIRSAKDRLLLQTLYIEEDWVSQESLLSEVALAASRGVQVRVLLDSAWSYKENALVAEHLNEAARRGGWDLEAKIVSRYHDFGIVHNKGMVVDDIAVVSSLNWCDPALRDNREIGLAITSAEVSGYFAEVFWTAGATIPIRRNCRFPGTNAPWGRTCRW